MMELKFWIIFISQIYPIFAISMYVETQRSYEFEDVLSDEQGEYWVWRSEASRLKTLRLVDHHQVYRIDFKICIEPVEGKDRVSFYIDDIRYANDGPNDTISVTFDGEYWDEYSTNEKWAHGHDWNIFRNSGRVKETKFLSEGEYVIGVSVKTDKWGIELDKIRVISEYQVLDSEIFCGGRLVNTNYTWMQDEIDFIRNPRL